MKHDAEQTRVNVRAFNRWLEDDWGFADERLVSTPMVSLLDPDHAVAEIEWLRDRGAKCVHLRPGPQGGRSPADPVFDPFWARLVEAEMVVVLHISESSYNELISTSWSEPAHPSAWEISAFQWTTTYGDRPIMDTLAAMVLHNLFGRFPGLRVMSLENGSIWVPYLLSVMDKMKGMGRNSPWLGGPVRGRPSDIFREHVWVSPYHEEDIAPLVDAIGVDRILFGSDYPHPEGIVGPDSYFEMIAGLDPSQQQRIMRDNLLELLGR